MRTMRPGVAMFTGALAAMLMTASNVHAQQTVDPYAATLHFGTGLINTPVAWVSPRSGDAWLNTSAKHLPSFPDQNQSLPGRLNTNIALETHWLGRFSVGGSIYSQNPEYGFFAQALLLRAEQFGPLPAVAVGVRNVGKFSHEDRFFIGHDIELQADNTYKDVAQERYRGFDTSPTLYVVATKDLLMSNVAGRMPSPRLSLNVGWGNGLFSEDGGLGKDYNAKGTIAKGLFLGGRYVMEPTLNSTLSLLAENDAWDWNAGAVYDWRGIQIGAYATEIEEGGRDATGFNSYNYTKWNVSIGYAGNIIDISHGVLLRSRITELQREQQRLRLEIAQRERRIRGLEVALGGAQTGELADIEKRRQELETSVQQEREAIRRAEERLRQIQSGQQPPSTTPPPVSPDTTTPPTTSHSSNHLPF